MADDSLNETLFCNVNLNSTPLQNQTTQNVNLRNNLASFGRIKRSNVDTRNNDQIQKSGIQSLRISHTNSQTEKLEEKGT